jgi:hypothetical protein
MITLSLLLAACFTLVSPQLALAQHTALMELYDALGVATDIKRKFFFFFFFLRFSLILLFRLFSFTVPALCGDCTVLWQWSDVFWKQRDWFVRMEVCLCCGLMFSSIYRFLSNNQLTGTIPSTVGQLSSLQFL